MIQESGLAPGSEKKKKGVGKLGKHPGNICRTAVINVSTLISWFQYLYCSHIRCWQKEKLGEGYRGTLCTIFFDFYVNLKVSQNKTFI